MSLEESILAERDGYRVAVDSPGDEDNPATFRAQAGNIILDTGLGRDEAESIVVARWKSDRATAERRVALGNEAKTNAAARQQLHSELVAAADRLAARFPDAEIDVHDGSPWLARRRMTSEAIEAELLVSERAKAARREYMERFDAAVAAQGFRVRLAEDDEMRRDNTRLSWGEQYVDVLVPVTHPAVPTTGRVEVVDGEVVLETAPRDDLAQRIGVVYPETIDERVARREALEAAHRRNQQRADDLAEQARRAADEARGGVSA